MGELRAARWSGGKRKLPEQQQSQQPQFSMLPSAVVPFESGSGGGSWSGWILGGSSVFKENLELDVSDLISISISISGLQEAPPPTRAWSRPRFHSLPDRFYICVGIDWIDLSDRDSNHFQIPEG